MGFVIWFLIIGTAIIAVFSRFGVLSILLDLAIGITFMYLWMRTVVKLKLGNRNGK